MSEEIKDQELERDEQTAAEEQTDCQTNEQAQPQEEELTDSPAEELSPEAKLQAELDKLKDTYLRLVAEYDNYRKRTLKEKSELIRSGGEKALTDLLPVVDDLEIALQNLDKDRAFLKAGGVFSDDQIDSFIELKMTEVMRYEMTPHPIEFVQYYSL